MAGKPGRSGPPMLNTNAVKRPWRTFWTRRALRPRDKWILSALHGYADALVQDRGGQDQVTAVEARMIEIAQTARGCIMLIMAEAAARGFTTPENGSSWDLQPGVKELAKFLTLERNALISLGLGRRAHEGNRASHVVIRQYENSEPPRE